MWNAQNNALTTAILSPILTWILSNSVKRIPPNKQIIIASQTELWINLEKNSRKQKEQELHKKL